MAPTGHPPRPAGARTVRVPLAIVREIEPPSPPRLPASTGAQGARADVDWALGAERGAEDAHPAEDAGAAREAQAARSPAPVWGVDVVPRAAAARLREEAREPMPRRAVHADVSTLAPRAARMAMAVHPRAAAGAPAPEADAPSDASDEHTRAALEQQLFRLLLERDGAGRARRGAQPAGTNADAPAADGAEDGAGGERASSAQLRAAHDSLVQVAQFVERAAGARARARMLPQAPRRALALGSRRRV